MLYSGGDEVELNDAGLSVECVAVVAVTRLPLLVMLVPVGDLVIDAGAVVLLLAVVCVVRAGGGVLYDGDVKLKPGGGGWCAI